MKYNGQIYKKLTGKELVLGSDMNGDEGSDNFHENPDPPIENGESGGHQNGDAETGKAEDVSPEAMLSKDVDK
eukprot:scaffold126999_cov23-Cyclotella_meneghiniana.AAC.1